MQLAELITAAATLTATEQGRADFIAALQRDVQPVYQAIYASGSTATQTIATAERTALETRAAEAETALAAARARVTELEGRSDTPEIARVRQELNTEIARLTTEAQTRETALRERIQVERTQRAMEVLREELVAAGVDPFMADTIVERPGTAARLRFSDDGKMSVLQTGTENISLQVGADSTPLRVYASELKSPLDARWLTSGVEPGPGARSDVVAGGGGGGYDPAAAGKALAAEQKATAGATDLAFK